ncbi:MAG: ABC transporter ATP-binding protein [Thermoanaerobaculia bacterium]|nr:ABC transporter ATP-binding protein [Thermoanaerobaculia bacterium]
MTDLLTIDSIDKSFGAHRVLEQVSLRVPEGEVLALLGPSGSGKTTLLRLLAGFERADGGRIEIAGEDVTSLAPAKRGVGMVFQHYALFPHLDVGKNVAFGLSSLGFCGDQIAARVAEVLALVDLVGFERRAVGELSGGQQQRVAVARALAPRPRLLLLDEPLSNLDPMLRERTRRALRTLVREVGITTVLVTHEQQEAFDLGDRIALLYEGRLQQVGPPDLLYEKPVNRFVATFVGRPNFLRGEWVATEDGEGVRLTRFEGAPVWPGERNGPALDLVGGAELMLRPEALQFVSAGDPLAVAGRVVERAYGGGISHFRVSLPERDGEAVEVEVLDRSSVAAEGDAVFVAPQLQGPRGRIWGTRTGASE